MSTYYRWDTAGTSGTTNYSFFEANYTVWIGVPPGRSPRLIGALPARIVARMRKVLALADRPGTPAEGDAAVRLLLRLMGSAGIPRRSARG